ncbi:hypothetical protein TrST_g8257 [Triparma strigata]|uniref:Ribonuclease n=1 Tax=Triparma strigata TaxID=1606541 RepID=A0A9W7EJ40_9STRA|nr:hypothetical protein TrST_g8257 [Triparma strigata]
MSELTPPSPPPAAVTPGLSSFGKPTATRAEAVELFKVLTTGGDRPEEIFHSTGGDGLTFMSDVPESCLGGADVVLGIDEAGRGSVLGPMTYSAAYWPVSMQEEMEQKPFDDSKALTHEKRRKYFELIQDTPDCGYVVRVLQASEISRNMLRKVPYNLNDMSHDSAMEMIRNVQRQGVKLTKCIIDTVGIPESYKRKLDKAFEGQGIEFIVEKKADANYKCVSAASICAKVARDEITPNWVFPEEGYTPVNGKEWNSGYPSDPKCKAWMESNLVDKVFCYPDVIRFSWGPIKDRIEERGVPVVWEDEDEETGQSSMSDFLGNSDGGKRKRQRLGGNKVQKGIERTELF